MISTVYNTKQKALLPYYIQCRELMTERSANSYNRRKDVEYTFHYSSLFDQVLWFC